eukprot:7171529-Pyramimonas_sp.AAC.1
MELLTLVCAALLDLCPEGSLLPGTRKRFLLAYARRSAGDKDFECWELGLTRCMIVRCRALRVI